MSDLEPGLITFAHLPGCPAPVCTAGTRTACWIKRSRPELSFVQSCPAVLLVTTIFWRAVWRYHDRGYRSALLDAGHMVENLVTAAKGMGMQTMTWLSMNDSVMRELIGVGDGEPSDAEEAVQGMVVWVNLASCPIDPAQPPRRATNPADPLTSIKRRPLSPSAPAFDAVLAAHRDCVADEAPREIRDPLTELTPLPPQVRIQAILRRKEVLQGLPVRQVLSERRACRDFSPGAIPVDHFCWPTRWLFRRHLCALAVGQRGDHPAL